MLYNISKAHQNRFRLSP